MKWYKVKVVFIITLNIFKVRLWSILLRFYIFWLTQFLKCYSTILFLLLSSFGARIKEFVVATNSLKMRTRLSRNHLRFFLSTDVWAYAGTCDNFYIISSTPFSNQLKFFNFVWSVIAIQLMQNFVILAYARKNLIWSRF